MSEKIEIYMKNQKGNNEYSASAIYEDGKITIKKGSKINEKIANSATFKLNSKAQSKRDEKGLYDSEGILLKDVIFDSASTAGQFVCGYSVSGMVCWRDKNKKTLKQILKGE